MLWPFINRTRENAEESTSCNSEATDRYMSGLVYVKYLKTRPLGHAVDVEDVVV